MDGQIHPQPPPQKIVWHQSGVTHDRFYWLAVGPGKAKPGSTIIARIENQNIILESVEQVEQVRILLNDRLFDLDKPIRVQFKGKTLLNTMPKRTAATIYHSIQDRLDPELIYSATIDVPIPTAKDTAVEGQEALR